MTTLTTREIDVFKLILDGKSDWEIALILSISAKTVNYHVENAKRKLVAGTRLRAIAVALRDGLVAFPATVVEPIDLDDPRRARPSPRTPSPRTATADQSSACRSSSGQTSAERAAMA